MKKYFLMILNLIFIIITICNSIFVNINENWIVVILIELISSLIYYAIIQLTFEILFNLKEKRLELICFVFYIIRIIILIIINPIYSKYCYIELCCLLVLAFLTMKMYFEYNSFKESFYDYFCDVDIKNVRKYGIDNIDDLKQKLYKNFIDIKNSMMNYDYNTLKFLLTDNLYNKYSSKIDTIKQNNEKNIISDFEYIDSKIYNIKFSANTLFVRYYLKLKMYNYFIDKDNKIINGNNTEKEQFEYTIVFYRKLNDIITECPNCGAKIEKYKNNCNYCNYVVPNSNGEWLMGKEECISQKKLINSQNNN